MKFLTTFAATAAFVNPASAFTCTGFDPVFTPEGPVRFTKAAAYAESVRRTNEAHESFLAAVDLAVDATEKLPSGQRSTSAGVLSEVNIPIRPFALQQIALPNGTLLKTKQDRDLAYLLSDVLKPDNVLFNFRNTSGLPQPNGAMPWGGWEDPSCLLRGHFSGHWLSASALMYNSTGNPAVKARLDQVISGLAEVQAALAGTPPAPGYLSGFPVQQFIDLENLVPYPKQWSPYYTIHKIMAGLRDAYLLAGSTQALSILEGMASYFRYRIDAIIARGTIALWHAISNQEFGGMNEVLYDLAAITGNTSYLQTAHYFDKSCFLGPLALGDDDLNGMHANAHEPVVIGGARRYEVTGDVLYSSIATTFHSIVTHDHAYATGNGNHGEYWALPGRMGDSLDGDTEESCTSYNMLKLGRHVFGWTGDVAYPDWHERLFINGMLSTQRNRDTYGQMIYMLPLSAINGTSKGWGDPIYTMTCCYGSGIESFAKVGDSLYYQSMDNGVPHLWVAMYFDSALTWPAVGGQAGTLGVTQSVTWDGSVGYGQIRSALSVQVSGVQSLQATISLRVPSWAQATSTATLNGSPLPGPLTPLSWLNISRVWAQGDVISVSWDMALRVEWIRDDRPAYATTGAIMVGPFLLVAPTPSNPSAIISNGTLYNDPSNLDSWIVPLSAQERNWTSLAALPYSSAVLRDGPPSFLRHDARNMEALVTPVDVVNTGGGSDSQDSTLALVQPGLTGAAGTVTIRATNYPSFVLCDPSQLEGSTVEATDATPLSFLNLPTNTTGLPGSVTAACTFVLHNPGLSGAGTVSLELVGRPGVYASWYANHSSGATSGAVTAQALYPGPAFANATSWVVTAPNTPVPPFVYRTVTSSWTGYHGSEPRALPPGPRAFGLYPIMDADTEEYVSYYIFSAAADPAV